MPWVQKHSITPNGAELDPNCLCPSLVMSVSANEFSFLCATAKFRRPELNRFIVWQVHVLHSDETTMDILQPQTDQ